MTRAGLYVREGWQYNDSRSGCPNNTKTMASSTYTSTPEEQADNIQRAKQVLKRFGKKRPNLIPILQAVQKELGFLPEEAMLQISGFLNIPSIDVYSVVTFYNQFRVNPPGKHSIRVCLGTACHMKGGYVTLDAWRRRLGIDAGETTADREFDLDTVACVGCCTMAPVTVVDEKPEGHVEPTKVDGILLALELERQKESKEKE
ncbi:MAG: NAD(P)H-dependent oxidoreductase subunit E [Chloroflexota bacterium]